VSTDAFIAVDGLRVRTLEAGAGPAVLLLHGASLGSSGEVFAAALDPLAAAGYRAIAYDQPGYGLTDNPRDFSSAYRAAFILRLLDALGIDQATLVGHSQAGLFAIENALTHPARVRAVAIVATRPLLPPLTDARGPAPGRERSSAGEGLPADPTLDAVRTLLESDVYHKDRITPAVVERRHQLSIGKNAVAAAERGKVREGPPAGKPPWQQLADLTQPLIMLYGDHDRAAAGQRAVRFKEQHPAIDVRVVKDAAHLLMGDAPEVFLTTLLEFLARVHLRISPAAAR
jgi:2-hydroxymuconate-semialdehyde hydrolase/2-hydroxy-6-oxo-octa-2,4-dienoate hydrolase